MSMPKKYINCTECGSWILQRVSPKNDTYIGSSDYVEGFTVCQTCLVEYCTRTECTECKYKEAHEIETCPMRSVREFYLEEEDEEYFTGFSFKNNVRDSNIERKVVQVIKGEDGKCYDDSGNCYIPNELAVEDDCLSFFSFEDNESEFVKVVINYKSDLIKKMQSTVTQIANSIYELIDFKNN